MNIFEVLSNGKGRINEENVSAFLGYLLDPNENHDLGSEFFEKFLTKIGIKEDEIKATDIDNIEINYEFKVCPDNKKCRYIDIVFETADHIIAIENKISENAMQKNQLQEEYDGLKLSDEKKSIFICYLVPDRQPDEEPIQTEQIKTEKEDSSIILFWNDVIEILKDILQKENSSQINPINDYVKQTIKAFINFRRNTSKPRCFTLNGQRYNIYKYSSGSIYVYRYNRNENSWVKVSAKDVIRQKLKELDPEKYNDDKINTQNTRSLGAKLIKML